jgi:AcrR family transcriptional regulator
VYVVHSVKRDFGSPGKAVGMAQQTEAPRRVRLSRDRVLRAAVALADAAETEGLSMRKLAQELGVVPMALYKHVANKEELLDGMVDVVFGEVEFSGGAGWGAAMRERAISMRQALLRHPWAVGLMESRTPGPANLRHHNAVMACLRQEAGFSFRMAVHAYSAMDSYIYGFALQEKTLPFKTPEESAEEAERRLHAVADEYASFADAYPYLFEVVVELGKSGYDYDEEFEFALDLILDGIERLRRRELGSTKGQGKTATKR